MKITIQEYEGCFCFDLTAESMADAALLARFALNAKKEIRGLASFAEKDGSFNGYVTINKAKKSTGQIKRGGAK